MMFNLQPKAILKTLGAGEIKMALTDELPFSYGKLYEYSEEYKQLGLGKAEMQVALEDKDLFYPGLRCVIQSSASIWRHIVCKDVKLDLPLYALVICDIINFEEA